MNDSVSATISLSPKVSLVRYVVQTTFLFLITLVSVGALWMGAGTSDDLWVMLLVLCISQVLNLPTPATLTRECKRDVATACP